MNWTAAALGGIVLAIVVAVIDPVLPRVLAGLAALGLTFYLVHIGEEQEIESPLLEQLREDRPGLDRRKYGRLRSFTDRFLDHVREVNNLAVGARQGKIPQRQAHTEMDRVAARMRDMVDEICKAAGVPTPVHGADPKRKVVEPRGSREGEKSEAASERGGGEVSDPGRG